MRDYQWTMENSILRLSRIWPMVTVLALIQRRRVLVAAVDHDDLPCLDNAFVMRGLHCVDSAPGDAV